MAMNVSCTYGTATDEISLFADETLDLIGEPVEKETFKPEQLTRDQSLYSQLRGSFYAIGQSSSGSRPTESSSIYEKVKESKRFLEANPKVIPPWSVSVTQAFHPSQEKIDAFHTAFSAWKFEQR